MVNDSQGRRLLWSRVLVRCLPGNQMNWKCQHKCQHWMWEIHPVCVSQDIFTLLFCIKCFLSWCPPCWDHMISPVHNSHGDTNTTFQHSVLKLFTLVRLTLYVQCKFWILKQNQLRPTELHLLSKWTYHLYFWSWKKTGRQKKIDVIYQLNQFNIKVPLCFVGYYLSCSV